MISDFSVHIGKHVLKNRINISIEIIFFKCVLDLKICPLSLISSTFINNYLAITNYKITDQNLQSRFLFISEGKMRYKINIKKIRFTGKTKYILSWRDNLLLLTTGYIQGIAYEVQLILPIYNCILGHIDPEWRCVGLIWWHITG